MEELKLQAQKALQTGRGMLLTASGDILHGALTVGQASLRTGDVLTLHLRETSMAATASAFAAVLGVSRPLLRMSFWLFGSGV